MFPNILMWVSVLLAVASATPLLKTNQNLSGTGPIRPQMREVVSVEGKSYFVEDSPERTWNQANSYCESFGMRLASISTSEQYTALQNAYDANNFNGEYWTSAKTPNALTQFRWNRGTGGEIGDFLTSYYIAGNENLDFNSFTFKIESLTKSSLHGNRLSKVFGTLCETY